MQQLAVLFEDVRRTEPFARMSRGKGIHAQWSLLQTPRAWWFCLSDGLSKKRNSGKRSWALFLASAAHILGFLAISSLSASFLFSDEVAVPLRVDFRQMVPNMDASLSLNPLRETYFRAIGNLLQGVPTSAWLSGSYMIMPSWPSNIQRPLGPRLGEAVQTWQFTTTVLTNELGCVPMDVTAHG